MKKLIVPNLKKITLIRTTNKKTSLNKPLEVINEIMGKSLKIKMGWIKVEINQVQILN